MKHSFVLPVSKLEVGLSRGVISLRTHLLARWCGMDNPTDPKLRPRLRMLLATACAAWFTAGSQSLPAAPDGVAPELIASYGESR